MQAFTKEVRKDTYNICEKIYNHPFLIELADGRLPYKKFLFYLQQDDLFLREFCRFLGMTVAKSDTLEQVKFFSDLLKFTVEGEMEMHQQLASHLGFKMQNLTSISPTPTTTAYASYLLRIASVGSLSEVVVAMAPCPWTYLEISERLLRSKGITKKRVYREWCSFYASQASREGVNKLLNLLDTLAQKAHLEERKKMKQHFLTTSRYEYLFWDMAYHLENWPI